MLFIFYLKKEASQSLNRISPPATSSYTPESLPATPRSGSSPPNSSPASWTPRSGSSQTIPKTRSAPTTLESPLQPQSSDSSSAADLSVPPPPPSGKTSFAIKEKLNAGKNWLSSYNLPAKVCLKAPSELCIWLTVNKELGTRFRAWNSHKIKG